MLMYYPQQLFSLRTAVHSTRCSSSSKPRLLVRMYMYLPMLCYKLHLTYNILIAAHAL